MMKKGKILIFIFLFAALLIENSCCNCPKGTNKNNNYENKFDTALKQVMNNEGSDNEIIQCLIEIESQPDSLINKKIEDSGLKINTITGNIITCEGKKSAFRSVAIFEFVRRIELSKKLFKQEKN